MLRVSKFFRAGFLGLSLLVLLVAGTSTTPVWAKAPVVDHVLIVSVDGLRSDFLLAISPNSIPNFTQLAQGSSTLNARTIFSHTVTLPNHTSMLTGRPVFGVSGHQYKGNKDPSETVTLHSNLGEYVAGVYDVAHDHGLRTAIYASKTKFSLFDRSWDHANGSPDVTGEDNGRDKIDTFVITKDTSALTRGVISELTNAASSRSLILLHYRNPDRAGHKSSWDLTPGSAYVQSIIDVDQELGQIMETIRAHDELKSHTAIILTTDHGGVGKKHSNEQDPNNYTIPFLVWFCDTQQSKDLYALNPVSRTDPDKSQPDDVPAPNQPIRNAEAGNLALYLLGLPGIPNSVVNSAFDLVVFEGTNPCGR